MPETTPTKPRRRLLVGAVLIFVAGGAASFAFGPDRLMGYMHGHGGLHQHGADGMGHDMANMPGLRGANTTAQETAEMALMFRGFETITREVTNLPDGIRTVTRSSDPEVMAALVSHVTVMIDRVENLDDPQVLIQSPTLDVFFQRGEDFENSIEVTDEGIVVVQTAVDPELVTALQVHAAEVSDMADRGMDAVHDRMMARQ